MRNSSRFDQEAAQWDQNPGRVETARAVGEAIRRATPLQPNWRVLDYGAGTGLLTLCLQPYIHSMVALDSSNGMIDTMRRKLVSTGIRNVEARRWDLEAHPFTAGEFDLVVSSMTLHLLHDIPFVLGRLVALLKPGGWLAVADLDPEDGSFHSNAEGVFHQGFERRQIAAWLAQEGLLDVTVTDAHSLRKLNRAGEPRVYGIFLATGQKASEGTS